MRTLDVLKTDLDASPCFAPFFLCNLPVVADDFRLSAGAWLTGFMIWINDRCGFVVTFQSSDGNSMESRILVQSTLKRLFLGTSILINGNKMRFLS